MKISLNWIKEFVDLNEIDVKEIADKLTMSGLEVEEITDQNSIYKNFIVAEVLEVSKHPDADRLSVCRVTDGNDEFQVVCGAKNVAANQKVVFAKIGAVIPLNKLTIARVKLRGVESEGMICAEDELGLSDNHSGIMVLEDTAIVATPVTEALGLNNVIFEIAVTPNRPDALSHLGVARDLSAIFNRELKIPKISIKESETDINKLASIDIEDTTNCPRYSAKVLSDIEVKESPDWIKNKLKNIGLRPINNIVDVTNIVLHETGQPLHAFDLDLLSKNKIIVKSTKTKTKFTTLDSKQRELDVNTLMICDTEKDIAIAGVMGGENSEVNKNTRNVLIESAYFNPSSIRNTSKGLMLSTDASYRFERGTDPSNTVYAAERAAQIMAEVSGGKIAKGTIDVYPKRILVKEIILRLQRITKILGYEIEKNKVIQILQKLGINLLKDLGDSLLLVIPTFRPDLEREVDLIEEVARIAGYDKIPTISKISITLGEKVDDSILSDNVRELAKGLGLNEMICNPLQSKSMATISGKPIEIQNPQNNEMKYLRTTLLTGALAVVATNINKGEKDLSLFEIGNVFNLNSEKNINSFEDVSESTKLIIVLTGNRVHRKWNMPVEEYDYYSLKGLVKEFYDKILLDNVLIDSYHAIENSIFEYSFEKVHNESRLGVGGKVNRKLLSKFDIEQDVFCFEFDLDKMKLVQSAGRKFNEPLKYPKITRDFSFIFEKSTSYDDVLNLVKSEASELLKSFSVFDLFESEEFGEGYKSMAFNLEYFDNERTLTEDEVDKDIKNLINVVSKKLNAKLRGDQSGS